MKRRWIILALTVLFLWVIVSRFTELEQFKNTLAQGKILLLLIAGLVQILYYLAFAWSYQSALDTVDLFSRTRDLIPLTLGALFINVVVPAGGAGGAALFTDDLTRRGKPAPRVAAGILLQLITDFAAFTLLLIPGMLYLFIKHDLKVYETVAALILVLMTMGLSSVLMLGVWKPEFPRRLFGWLQHTASWLFGRLNRTFFLADNWAQVNADEFNQAATAVKSHPFRLARTVGICFLAHLLDITMLYILFLAFNQPVDLGPLIAGYAVGILFWIVSITPQGIGIVEGVMALVFTSLGVPGAIATTVALVFRGLTFWIPMFLGYFAIQKMKRVSSNHFALADTWGRV